MKKYRTASYADGGVNGGKKKKVKKETSSAYEANRQKNREESEASANLVRRQMAINRANQKLANPEAYETQQQRAASPAYKTVSGRAQGISSSERAGASMGTVGSMTPEAAKRSEAAMKKPATAAAPAPAAAPVRTPGGISPETQRKIEAGKSRSAELGKQAMTFTMEEAKRKGYKLKYGGMIKKSK